LAMPDLDLIKQEEQGSGTGARGLPRSAGNPDGGQRTCRDQG
jgi:hypothetical protein